ncbi:MAG: helix-turn-helix transcriptional regulator [Oscillospiraceae bacterium]|nr:helix-turn-helix transcriptional regulator [Oscillospiraceae bacterium]
MTRKNLAERLNLPFRAVSKWENRDSLPKMGILPELCDLLNTTADSCSTAGS